MSANRLLFAAEERERAAVARAERAERQVERLLVEFHKLFQAVAVHRTESRRGAGPRLCDKALHERALDLAEEVIAEHPGALADDVRRERGEP